MQIDNLNKDETRNLMLRQRANDVMAPLGKSSISRGALRILSPEGLIVKGSSSVTGTQTVSGTHNVSGTENVTGTLNVSGDLNVTGTEKVTGTLDISGLLKLIGNALLTGDLIVGAGGEITVAGSPSATLGVTSSGYPGLEWNGSGWVAAIAGNGVVLSNSTGSAFTRVTPTAAAIVAGNKSVQVTSSAVTITNLPTTTEKPNLYVHPTTGVLYRSTGISA